MKRDKKRPSQLVLILNLAKWFFLAVIIGVIVGAVAAFFLKILYFLLVLIQAKNIYYISLPLAFFFSSLMVKYLAPQAEGFGTEKVIAAVHKNRSKISIQEVMVKIFASLITLAGGGSGGKGGPCIQIGSGVVSILGKIFRFSYHDRRKLVICGISAAFSAAFGVPVAGAFFGVEVLFIGRLLYDVLFPAVIAAVVSYKVAAFFGVSYFYHALNIPFLDKALLFKVVLAAVIFGLGALLLIVINDFFSQLAGKIHIWPPFKGVIAGIVLFAMAYFSSFNYLGLGSTVIGNILLGVVSIAWYVFFLKIIFTAITLNFGGSAGIISPIFFIGAALGSSLSSFFHVNPQIFAALGLVSVFAGAANAPIAASLFAIEVFGANIAPYAIAACVISFIITGYRSIFPSQIPIMKRAFLLKIN